MPRIVPFEGKSYSFPDDVTDDEVAKALTGITAPPPMSDVLSAAPGAAKRQIFGLAQGVHRIVGDLTGSESIQRDAQDVRLGLDAETQEETPKNMTTVQKGVHGGVASAISAIPIAVGAGVATAGAGIGAAMGLGTTLFGLQTGFNRYGELRGEGFSGPRSFLHGMAEGLIEKYTEYLPMKDLVGNKTLWNGIKGFLWKDFTGEQIATLGQDISAKLSDRPDMTLGDYFHDMAVTAIATPVGAGVQLGGIKTAQALLPDPYTKEEIDGATPPLAWMAPTGNTPPASPPPAGPIVPPGSISDVVPPTTTTEPPAPPPHPAAGTKVADDMGIPIQVYETQDPANPGVFTPMVDAVQISQDPNAPVLPAEPMFLNVTNLAPSEKFYEILEQKQAAAKENELVKPEEVYEVLKSLGFDGTEILYKHPVSGEHTTAYVPFDKAQVLPGVSAESLPAAVKKSVEFTNSEPESLVSPVSLDISEVKNIVFPDKVAQALWNLGAALQRVQKRNIPADSARIKALQDRLTKVSGMTNPVEMNEKANRYVFGMSLSGLREAKGEYHAPTVEDAITVQKAHEQHVINNTNNDVKAGQVVWSTGTEQTPWQKKMQGYLQSWVKTFSPQMRVVIMGNESVTGNRAQTQYYGGVHYVYLPRPAVAAKDLITAIYVLAHEFGHMLISQHINDPKYAVQRDALIAEYSKYVGKVGSQTAPEFVDEFRTPIDVLQEGSKIDPNKSALEYIQGFPGGADYALSFEEWAADQYVRFVHTNKTYLDIPGERGFWQVLTTQLKDFFKKVVNKFAPSESFKDWIATLPLRDSGTVGEVTFNPMSMANKEVRAKPGVDFRRLNNLLGAQLYGNPRELFKVSIKEMFQNSFDAVRRAVDTGEIEEGKITITTEEKDRTITITDNGRGMSPEILSTKFLQIAGTDKEGDRNSGGLGIAKGLFLYGNSKIEVITTRDGITSTLETSGEELMLAATDPDTYQVNVQTMDNGNDSGTVVKVWLPETFRDPTTGNQEEIEFPDKYWAEAPVLDNSPLFSNIEVKFNDEVKPIGKNFPLNDYSHFSTIKFEWGETRVYVGKNDTRGENKTGYAPGDNVVVLSNGLWQFSESLSQKPGDSWGPNLPRLVYLEVTPKVKPDEPGYPFQLNRQGFTDIVKGEFGLLFTYLQMTSLKESLHETSANFGTMAYVDANGFLTESHKLASEVKEENKNKLFNITIDDKVEIVNNELRVNGRVVPLLTKEDLKKAKEINVGDFKLDQALIKHNEVIVHNNLDVPETLTLQKVKSKHIPVVRVGTVINNLPVEKPKMIPLTIAMRRLTGVGFDKAMYEFGHLMQMMRTTVVEMIQAKQLPAGVYNGIETVGLGVSFDKEFMGLNFKVPFRGVLLNPAAHGKYINPREQATEATLTVIHEFAHMAEMNHSDDFVHRFEELLRVFLVKGHFQSYVNQFEKLFTAQKPIFDQLVERYNDPGAKNSGKRLPGTSKGPGTSRGSDNVAVGQGTGSDGQLYVGNAGTEAAPGKVGKQRNVLGTVRAKLSQLPSKKNLEMKGAWEYTLKTLDRLPTSKDMIKKVTIYGEVARADVKKEERELIGKVVKMFPGETVDAKQFKLAVLNEIEPLRLNPTNKYASYGLDRLGVNKNDVGTETHIWEGPNLVYTSPHFEEDSSSYWAHTRGFGTGSPDRDSGGIWHIAELQSDSEQHDQEPGWMDDDGAEGSTIFAQINQADILIARLQRLQEFVQMGVGEIRQAVIVKLDEAAAYTTNFPQIYNQISGLIKNLEESPSDINRHVTGFAVGKILEDATLKVSELRARVVSGEERLGNTQNLPTRWWELVLRHELAWAGKNGFEKVRMATAETVAKVEGWTMVRTIPELNGKSIKLSLGRTYRLTGLQAIASQQVKGIHRLEVVRDGSMHPEWMSFSPQNDEELVPEILAIVEAAKGPFKPSEDVEGPYRRYKNDITKFVTKEFAGKTVVDDKDNTWLEFDTRPAMTWTGDGLSALPIQYYNLAHAVKETGNRIAAFGGVPELPAGFVKFQGFLQTTLQLNQMAKILPGVEGLQRYRTAMRTMHALKAKLFEGPNERTQEWNNLGYKQAQLVESALRDEQLGGQHWTELRQLEIDDGRGGKKMVWVHVPNAGFERLMQGRGVGKEGQNLMVGVKNDYLSTLQAMMEVVERYTLVEFERNPLVQTQRLEATRTEFAKLREMPYLPDMRFGKYTIQVRAGRAEVVDGRAIKKNELVYWEKFENERERDKRFKELKASYRDHKVSASYDSEEISAYRGLPQSLLQVMIESLNKDETTRLTPEQMSAIDAISFDQTAAGKFSKYLGTPAKHIGGASKDMRRAYAAYHWKTANAVAKLTYYKELTEAMKRVKFDADGIVAAGGKSDSYNKLHEYLQKNFTYVMNPPGEYEQLRMFVSLWYLWGSAKTAVMNLSSIPVLAYPYLATRFGDLQSQAALLRSMKDVVQYWKDPSKLSPDKQKVLEKMKADGVTDQSFASMLASVADGGVAFEKMIPKFDWLGGGDITSMARRSTWQITAMGMAPFRVIEQFNRQVVGLAAYELQVKKVGRTLSQGDTAAYGFAHDAVDYTQNEYGAWNRPPLLQGKSSIFLLFFSFVQNMSFLMFGGDKSWWRALMVLGVLGGLQGLPGIENLTDMFNWTLRKITGQNVDLRAEAREVAKAIGANPDLVMHGISHNWLGLGWDTSSSLGAGRIIPGTDAIFGIGKFEQRFVNAVGEVGGPAGSLLMSFLQALADDNPNALLRFDKALPPVLRNIEKMYVAADQGQFVNASGKPLVNDPTMTELVGQSLGFAPTRRTERQEELRAIKDAVTFYQGRRTNLMAMYYNARKTHDSEVMAEVRIKIHEFNSNVPNPSLRITSDDIKKSMEVRKRMDEETLDLKSPTRRYKAIYDAMKDS